MNNGRDAKARPKIIKHGRYAASVSAIKFWRNRRPENSLIVLVRVDVQEGSRIDHFNVALNRSVRAHHWLGTCDWIRPPNQIEQHTIDEHRMAMLATVNRTNDGSTRLTVSINHGSNGSRGEERHIHKRHKCRGNARSVNGIEPSNQRGQLPVPRVGVFDEPCNLARAGEHFNDALAVETHDHHHIVDAGTTESLYDSRQKRVAVFQQQIGFGTPHTRRGTGGKNDGWSHLRPRFITRRSTRKHAMKLR